MKAVETARARLAEIVALERLEGSKRFSEHVTLEDAAFAAWVRLVHDRCFRALMRTRRRSGEPLDPNTIPPSSVDYPVPVEKGFR